MLTLTPDVPVRNSLRVVMALYGDLTYDSRVIREAESLAAAGHAVTIACLQASPAIVERLAPSVRVVCHRPGSLTVLPGDPSPFLSGSGSRVRRLLERLRWLWRYRASLARWGQSVVASSGPADVWHAHDLTGLEAIAPNLDRSARIIYDSHELFLETGSATRLPGPARWLLRAREAQLVSRCEAMITVNPGLAAEFVRAYNPVRVEVVRNCPPRWIPPGRRPDLIREALGLRSGDSVVLFHGALVRGRGIQMLVSVLAAPGLERIHLVLLGNGSLYTALEPSAEIPAETSRVHVLPAVAPDELPDWVASADVGAVLQEPLDRNLVLSTPNKLFESIAVGTPVLASDLPEIRRVVVDDPDGPLGVLCDPMSQEAVAGALRELFAAPRRELLEMRERCHRASAGRLNWESEAAGLLRLYEHQPSPARSRPEG